MLAQMRILPLSIEKNELQILCFISFIDRLLKEKLASGVAEKLV
jgi:hypothetical protein